MELKSLDKEQLDLLESIAGIRSFDDSSAFNLRLNGSSVARNITENIKIIPKPEGTGIEIHVKKGTKGEQVHIPVLISQSGLKETVFNDFFIGEDSDVTVIAGCGIHNCGVEESEHSGIHSFYIGKNAKVKYFEKHNGSGDAGRRVMNPTTYVELEEGAYMEMDTVQLGGVDDTSRKTTAVVGPGAKITVSEKIMTNGNQHAETEFSVDLNGENSGAHLISRSVAKENSTQKFVSDIRGNAPSNGHSECDAIVMDNAKVVAEPRLSANDIDAALIHEAAIGKIAGEQITKLMTLGLTEKEAEEQIINGFLK